MSYYCHHCGKEVGRGNKFCPHCGVLLQEDEYGDRPGEYDDVDVTEKEPKKKKQIINESTKRELDTLIKIFMLIPTILLGFAIIPLIWMVPMTMAAWKKADNKEPYGLVLSVCSIIFMGIPVAGVMMIIRDLDTYGAE